LLLASDEYAMYTSAGCPKQPLAGPKNELHRAPPEDSHFEKPMEK